jgi:hypothetical protein
MHVAAKLLVVCALAACASLQDAHADKQTVCTITVNSADEKESFRRHLSADKYQFVELVERDRPDWLESACRTGIRCDVLVISGHYDGGNEFFSDRLEAREFLPVAEMERVSCSDSCPGLFSKLKEVYLFGCNTLNPDAQRSASAEVVRSLVREGKSPGEAARIASALNARHGESSRDRMRQVFKDVPVIYGFSSVAPLGPTAAATLNRYFQTTGNGEIGSGRASSRMLAQFAPHAMAVTRGITNADPHAGTRRDVCQFADDRLSNAQKLGFVHSLLRRQTAEARMFLDRLERHAATLDDAARQPPDVAAALAAIAADGEARDRFLEFARDADAPAVRARMFSLAGSFGWLSADERRAEVVRMMGDLLSRNAVGAAEVDLACTLNKDGDLDVASQRLPPPAADDGVAQAAVRACLGSAEGHARTLEGLVSSTEADVRVAQTYLRHHPIDDVDELREITERVAQMNGAAAQVRALEALGRHRMSDPQSLESLARLYRVAQTWNVQTAIAGILIRADYSSLKHPEFVRTLQEHRRKSPHGDDMIDALIRRLQRY